jgi:hypothetical protein
VPRTFRILRATLTLLSLLLCIACVVFWIRSRRVSDSLKLSPFPTKWSLSTHSGQLLLSRDRPWLEPAEVRPGIKTLSYERSFLGFGTRQSQESRTWQNQSASRSIGYTTNIKSYFVPLWFCCIVFSILPLIQYPRILRRLYRRRRGLCPDCGYDLRASPTKCPECGTTIQIHRNQKAPLPAPR